MRGLQNKVLQQCTHLTLHDMLPLLSAHSLSDSNFPEAAYTVDRLARRIEHLGYRVHLERVTISVA
jgi:hypothetical protein